MEITPLEKMLQNAGPVRADGTDKFFGLENVRRKFVSPLSTWSADANPVFVQFGNTWCEPILPEPLSTSFVR